MESAAGYLQALRISYVIPFLGRAVQRILSPSYQTAIFLF
jgi:hypothetical protein